MTGIRYRWLLTVVIVILVVATGLSLRWRDDRVPVCGSANIRAEDYRRIVSLAPSVTESLFALGLGDRVVGVTNYCDYPVEALTKSKIGGYYDLNYEAVVALQPDLLICLTEHAEHHSDLERLGLHTLTLDHDRVETILGSIESIGETCGAEARAEQLLHDIKGRMARVAARHIDERRPRVLVCIGRNMGSADLGNVLYIAGNDGFYSQMITCAGGVNAYTEKMAFPMVTGEGLLHLAPEVIIDMVPDLDQRGLTEAQVQAQWQQLPDLPAVRHGCVHVFTDDFVVIPGPRFIQILEKMAKVLHPEGGNS